MHNDNNDFSRVRFTAYLLKVTVNRIEAARKGRPKGYPIDDAFPPPVGSVEALLSRKTDRVPVRPHSGTPPVVKARPRCLEDWPRPTHPISCQCDACTLARLEAPQTRAKK